MKILLDENLPHALRALLTGHDVFTVAYLGWSGIGNGKLLQLAQQHDFDVFLTLDNGVPYQQNLAGLTLRVIVLATPSSDIDDLRPLVPSLVRHLSHPDTLNTATRISVE